MLPHSKRYGGVGSADYSNPHKKGVSLESLKKYRDKITPAVKDEVRQRLRKMFELLEHIRHRL